MDNLQNWSALVGARTKFFIILAGHMTVFIILSEKFFGNGVKGKPLQWIKSDLHLQAHLCKI